MRYHEPYWKYNGITSIARARIRGGEKLETRWASSRAESDSGNRHSDADVPRSSGFIGEVSHAVM